MSPENKWLCLLKPYLTQLQKTVSFMSINSPSVSEEGFSGFLFPLKY